MIHPSKLKDPQTAPIGVNIQGVAEMLVSVKCSRLKILWYLGKNTASLLEHFGSHVPRVMACDEVQAIV